MLAASLLSFLMAGIQLNTFIVVSLAATLIESLTRNSVLDELTVPSATAVLLHLLS